MAVQNARLLAPWRSARCSIANITSAVAQLKLKRFPLPPPVNLGNKACAPVAPLTVQGAAPGRAPTDRGSARRQDPGRAWPIRDGEQGQAGAGHVPGSRAHGPGESEKAADGDGSDRDHGRAWCRSVIQSPVAQATSRGRTPAGTARRHPAASRVEPGQRPPRRSVFEIAICDIKVSYSSRPARTDPAHSGATSGPNVATDRSASFPAYSTAPSLPSGPSVATAPSMPALLSMPALPPSLPTALKSSTPGWKGTHVRNMSPHT